METDLGTDGMDAKATAPRAVEKTHPPCENLLASSLSMLKILWIFTIIGCLFAVEYYFLNLKEGTPGHPWTYYLHWTLPTTLSQAVITPAILRAASRWGFERGQRLRVFVLHLSLLLLLAPIRAMLDVGFTALGLMITSDFEELNMLWDMRRPIFLAGLAPSPVYYVAIAAFGYTTAYYRKFRERELASSHLERALAQAHLETLTNQLSPHFLFNTLHAIGTLARTDAEGTRRMVTLLSDLLRRSIGTNQEPQVVPLERELDFVRKYLEIEEILYSDRLRVEVQVPEALTALPVPNFILQPIVENSIKHGIAKRSGPGTITLSARLCGDSLEIAVADDGTGLVPGVDPAEGRGLGITRERLRGLYGERATLTLENRPGGGVLARIGVPLPKSAPRQGLEPQP
ncbi:MAG: sensor histidine kinase [Acidobacteriota bacterium]